MENKAIEIAFFVECWENEYVQSIQSEVTDCGVRFTPNFPPFIDACSLRGLRFASASQAFNEKSFSQEFLT